MEVSEYMQRIGIDEINVPNLAFLSHLVWQHLYCIAFENLDIHLEREIVLDLALNDEKIGVRPRVGFCYELNGLFCEVNI